MLRVLEIDERGKNSQLTAKELYFKLLLVPEDDINCTSNVTLVEGHNFWWVRQKTFEGAWFSHVDKAAAEAEAAAAEAAKVATAAAVAAAAAAESTEKEKKASNLEKLFEKTKGERDGTHGHFYKCLVPGCLKKDHYFVKSGESNEVCSVWRMQITTRGSKRFI